MNIWVAYGEEISYHKVHAKQSRTDKQTSEWTNKTSERKVTWFGIVLFESIIYSYDVWVPNDMHTYTQYAYMLTCKIVSVSLNTHSFLLTCRTACSSCICFVLFKNYYCVFIWLNWKITHDATFGEENKIPKEKRKFEGVCQGEWNVWRNWVQSMSVNVWMLKRYLQPQGFKKVLSCFSQSAFVAVLSRVLSAIFPKIYKKWKIDAKF